MLQDHFNELMDYFKNLSPEKTNLEEGMSKALDFFRGMKQELMSATPEEREKLMTELTGMYSKLMTEAQGMAERMGLTQEQLLKMAENMKHFTPEQQKLIQKTQQQMSTEVTELSRFLGKVEVEREMEKKPEEAKPTETPPSEHPVAKRKTTRSKWIRS